MFLKRGVLSAFCGPALINRIAQSKICLTYSAEGRINVICRWRETDTALCGLWAVVGFRGKRIMGRDQMLIGVGVRPKWCT